MAIAITSTTMMSDKLVTSDGAVKSPFVLPAMADAYPLDPAERQAVDEFLRQLKHERANGDANGT